MTFPGASDRRTTQQRPQNLAQQTTPAQNSRFHRAGRDIQYFSHFFVGHPLEIPQNHRAAENFRHAEAMPAEPPLALRGTRPGQTGFHFRPLFRASLVRFPLPYPMKPAAGDAATTIGGGSAPRGPQFDTARSSANCRDGIRVCPEKALRNTSCVISAASRHDSDTILTKPARRPIPNNGSPANRMLLRNRSEAPSPTRLHPGTRGVRGPRLTRLPPLSPSCAPRFSRTNSRQTFHATRAGPRSRRLEFLARNSGGCHTQRSR